MRDSEKIVNRHGEIDLAALRRIGDYSGQPVDYFSGGASYQSPLGMVYRTSDDDDPLATGATASVAGTAGDLPAPPAGTVTDYLGRDLTWRAATVSTVTNGSATLIADYTCTATPANVGLNVTLPTAGKYLLLCQIRAKQNTTGGQLGDVVEARLNDTTNSVVIGATAACICTQATGIGLIYGSATLAFLYTTTINNVVIDLQAYFDLNNGIIVGLQTILSYCKLS